MTDLKIGKLPDRTPVKITFTASPDLNQALRDYAALYQAAYGEAESIPELIPFMLESFLESGRAFAKARKQTVQSDRSDNAGRRPRAVHPMSQPKPDKEE